MTQEGAHPGSTKGDSIADDALGRERRQIELALRGDAMAFRTIVERHHRGMHALALRMTGDRAAAEDLVQEAFARAYCRLNQFDPSYRLSTWLYRIVLNLCHDHHKSARRRERATDLDQHADDAARQPDALLFAHRRIQRVHDALARLRPAHREVLVLKDLQGLSYLEIRDLTGTPVTALKIRVIRARKNLRALLEGDPA